MTNGTRPLLCERFFCYGGRSPPQDVCSPVSGSWVDLRQLHPTLNNVAKMPGWTLLLSIWQRGFLLPGPRRKKGKKWYRKSRKYRRTKTEARILYFRLASALGCWMRKKQESNTLRIRMGNQSSMLPMSRMKGSWSIKSAWGKNLVVWKNSLKEEWLDLQ